jgi:hypothetical protein
MTTLNEYKRKIRNLFFISVKHDINKWYKSGMNDYYSPTYADCMLNIDISKKILYLHKSSNYKVVSKYQKGFLILDIKVWWYILRLKRHFKRVEQNTKVSEEITFMRNGLSQLEENFVKEVRKEKLEKINKV